ncbi:hypothetical protein LPJ61_001350 [Coemansia biformis]|uniref:Oxidoreductase-like domain-containing protein n=1 Tax=Coemansia biformis TaxID=1286918 RepID=A0A9W7YEH7_9FUNG|nr:hypothetical protein LPJ61_001350 [Coemansia biformis]
MARALIRTLALGWAGRGRRLLSARAPGAAGPDVEAMMRALPPKPEPPSNDDCCMSGCEFCVWDLYDEDMREYRKQAELARAVLEARGRPVPRQLRPESLRDAVDPAMRAFLDMERAMAARIQQEGDND